LSITEEMLKTKQAKEAIGEGFLTWILTGDLQKGWDAMISRGQKNGAYPAVKLAALFDFLKALTRS